MSIFHDEKGDFEFFNVCISEIKKIKFFVQIDENRKQKMRDQNIFYGCIVKLIE